MNGTVDAQNRALLEIGIRNSPGGAPENVVTWIDTAFDGHLVFSRSMIERLQLESLVETEAILADGQKVVLENLLCHVEWFGTLRPLQVIANEGKLPLLGTELLTGRVLHIDYAQRQLTLL
jgi:clan AA aspartic protease